MRLSFICEGFEKEDFFDFYTLQAMASMPQFANNPTVHKLLRSTIDQLYADLIDELSFVITDRFMDTRHDEVKDLYRDEMGVDLYDYDDEDVEEQQRIVRSYPIQKRLQVIRSVLKIGVLGSVTSDTWAELGRKLLKFADAKNTQSKMLTIDQIFQLFHHGGSITDYFEQDWLDDALNYKNVASFGQMLKNSSVKGLFGNLGKIGQNEAPVTKTSKLEVAFRRVLDHTKSWRYVSFDSKYDPKRDVVTIESPKLPKPATAAIRGDELVSNYGKVDIRKGKRNDDGQWVKSGMQKYMDIASKLQRLLNGAIKKAEDNLSAV